MPNSGDYSLGQVPTINPDSHWQAGQWSGSQPQAIEEAMWMSMVLTQEPGARGDTEIQTIEGFKNWYFGSQAFRGRSYH